MKGNSCSGVAAAAPENAMAPMASAPNAAARREFSLNASGLNIGRPLSDRPRAPVRRVVGSITTGRGFQKFCVRTPKWFRRGRELFRGGVATKQSFPMLAAGAAILAEAFTQSLSFRQRDGPQGPAMHVPRAFISAKVLPARLDANI